MWSFTQWNIVVLSQDTYLITPHSSLITLKCKIDSWNEYTSLVVRIVEDREREDSIVKLLIII